MVVSRCLRPSRRAVTCVVFTIFFFHSWQKKNVYILFNTSIYAHWFVGTLRCTFLVITWTTGEIPEGRAQILIENYLTDSLGGSFSKCIDFHRNSCCCWGYSCIFFLKYEQNTDKEEKDIFIKIVYVGTYVYIIKKGKQRYVLDFL